MNELKPMGELTRIRQERGLSQQGLADTSGVNKATINQIERGRRSPNVETLERLARALGVEVADFFPKAEAPLWSGEPPGRRSSSAFSFVEARESLERYCERWEKRLDDGTVDDRALEEFLVTMQGWIPMLDVALQAEIHAKGLVNGDTDIGRVNRRYLEVFDRIIPILKSRFNEVSKRPDEETNVVYLKGALASLGRLPNRAVG